MSHPCRNYCSQWNGEQCKGCMISDEAADGTTTNEGTVCIEHEPFEDFEAAHCAPKRKALEIKFDLPKPSRMTDLELRLIQKNHSLKANNKHWKIAAGIAVVLGVVGWML